MKVRKLLFYEFATKRGEILCIHFIFYFFLRSPLGQEITMSWYIMFLSTCFCGKSCFVWQTLLSVAKKSCDRNFFLWQKCVLLTKTRKETWFCYWKLVFWRMFLSDRNLFFWHKLFFSLTKICFCHRIFFCSSNSFLWQKIVMSKIPIMGFNTWFPGKSFREK